LSRSQNSTANRPCAYVTEHVKLSDFLTRSATESEFDLRIPAGAPIAEIIAVLAARRGVKFRQAVLDRQGNLHAGYAVVVNKQFIPAQHIAKTTIRHPCSLSIVPLAGGG
jgi:sulfur carrier protein ThiS